MIQSYNELVVQKYLQITKLVENAESDVEVSPKIISILADIPEKDLFNMPLRDYAELRGKAAFILTPPQPVKVQKAYKMKSFTLVPTTRIQKIVTAQYLDFQEVTKDGGDENTYVNVLACFLVPEGCSYDDGYDILDVREAILKEMSILDAEALYAFFFNRCGRLTGRMLTYSRRMLRKIARKKKMNPERIRETERMITMTEASLHGGAGWHRWTPCQRLSVILGTLFSPCR